MVIFFILPGEVGLWAYLAQGGHVLEDSALLKRDVGVGGEAVEGDELWSLTGVGEHEGHEGGYVRQGSHGLGDSSGGGRWHIGADADEDGRGAPDGGDVEGGGQLKGVV